MFGLLKLVIEFILFLLTFSAGIKFNQKWPNAASYLTGVWNLAEKFAGWAWSLFKATTATK